VDKVKLEEALDKVEETEVELSKLNERKKDLTDDGRY
jgi:hypothetical protein